MHKHGCKHGDIKLCEKCKIPYCEGCGQEWFESYQLNQVRERICTDLRDG